MDVTIREWVTQLPAFLVFILGLGGLAASLSAIIKLWRTIRPENEATQITQMQATLEDVQRRLGHMENEVAKIDAQAIDKRFDRIEAAIANLTNLIVETFAKRGDR